MRKALENINTKGKVFYVLIGIFLLVVSLLGSYIFKVFGQKIGTLPIVFTIGIIFVYAVVRLPRFGLIAMMVMANFLMFVMSTALIDFPLGTLMDGMLALMIIGFFIQQKYYKNFKVFDNPVSYLLLTWIIYNLIQVFNPNASSQMAWIYTIRTVAAMMLSYFLFVYYIISVKYIRTLFGVWLFILFLAALYAMKQEYFGFFIFEEYNHWDPLVQSLLFIDGHWRKNSFFSDPVMFSYNMVVGVLFCLAMLTGPIRKRYKLIAFSLICLFMYVMPFSGTRASYVLVPAAFILFVILRLNRNLMIIGIIGAICFYVLINIPTGNPTLYRFQTAFKPNNDASYNVRKLTQKKVQPYVQSHALGGGLGATGVWGVKFSPNSFLAKIPPDSGYVRVALELGWIGLFLICSIFATALYCGISNYFSIKDPELKMYCLAMVLIVFALSIANFPQEALVQFPMNINFYLFLAMIQVTKILDDKKTKEEMGIKEKHIKTVS